MRKLLFYFCIIAFVCKNLNFANGLILTTSNNKTVVVDMNANIGKGSFAKVYSGRLNDTEVAVKIEKYQEKQNPEDNFTNEIQIYEHISQFQAKHDTLYGIPTYHGHGQTKDAEQRDVRFIVLMKLGTTVNKLIQSNSSIYMIGREVTTALEVLQAMGIVMRDVKSTNIMNGATLETMSNIYLVDFGSAIVFVSTTSPNYQSFTPDLVGNTYHRSIEGHNTKYIGHGAVVEMMVYTVWKLVTGDWPWGHIKLTNDLAKFNRDIKLEKERLDFLKASRDEIDDPLAIMLHYARKLPHDTRPDYDFIRGLFLQMLMKDDSFSTSSVFSWVEEEFEDMNDSEMKPHLRVNPLSEYQRVYDVERRKLIWNIRHNYISKSGRKIRAVGSSSSQKASTSTAS